ncbi:MAG: flagellar hook-associated protein FlgL [Lachnospiraceae bacterium]|nr:flagellar hook-associated protein FlgL [Lachnospiraceae bacterium]
MMRVTNSMISRNSMKNMNNNKVNVDTLNTQMTTQKKIIRPSDDPIIAVRALRFRSNLSELNQYYERNIPDAQSWLEVTEGALNNMEKLLENIYTKCVDGSTDVKTQEDRAAILKDLQSLRNQIYAEGNTDYAGRTVFTGFKTTSQLTFLKEDQDIKYEITEPISYENIEEKRFYTNNVTVPNSPADVGTGVEEADMPQEHVIDRIRLSYEALGDLDPTNLTYTDANGNQQRFTNLLFQSGGTYVTASLKTDISYDDWVKDGCQINSNQAIFFKETGELILGEDLSNYINSEKLQLSITYEKKGFAEGEVRPEHYFDCKNITDENNVIEYTKENQEIKYTIAFNQDITINTQASEVLDANISRDVDELTNAVQAAIAAHDKVAKIESMMKEQQYSSEEAQKALGTWLEAAKKEATYADDNMQKIYARGITKFQKHQDRVKLARTDLGSRENRLKLTENRMANQQTSFEQLKSRNEDMELSDIIIEYTAAYNAYQASLQASAKANGQTLLNYL